MKGKFVKRGGDGGRGPSTAAPSQSASGSAAKVTTSSYDFFLDGRRGAPNAHKVVAYQKSLTEHIISTFKSKDLEKCVDITDPKKPELVEPTEPTLIMSWNVELPADLRPPARASTRAAATEVEVAAAEAAEATRVARVNEYQTKTAESQNAIARKKWENELSTYRQQSKELEQELTNLYGIMLRTMSSESKAMVMASTKGAEAAKDKDPVETWKAILSSHLLSTSNRAVDNFEESMNRFYNMSFQRETETITEFQERFYANLAAFSESARNAGQSNMVPNKELQAHRFVHTLLNKQVYGDFVDYCRRNDKTYETVEDAIQAAIVHGPNKNYKQSQQRVLAVTASEPSGGSGKGKDREKSSSGKGRTFTYLVNLPNRECAKCHKKGHMAKDCRGSVCPGCDLQGCRDTVDKRKQVDEALTKQRQGK
jgi:hypothetical protein